MEKSLPPCGHQQKNFPSLQQQVFFPFTDGGLLIVWQSYNWPDEELHIVHVHVSCLTNNAKMDVPIELSTYI